MTRTAPRAFTLVELLVVITIIVVLLALLTPALDQAVYQAELATCGAQLHSMGLGAQTYALDHQRHYPYRRSLWLADTVAYAPYDLRPIVRPYIPVSMMLDPLAPPIDISESTAKPGDYPFANYALRFGWFFTGQQGMRRMGDQWTWADGANTWAFSILASDYDRVIRNGNHVSGSPPDKIGRMVHYVDGVGQGTNLTLSRWELPTSHMRGAIDMNFVFTDGSVDRLTDVGVNDPLHSPSLDERMVRVPNYHNSTSNNWDAEWHNVPQP